MSDEKSGNFKILSGFADDVVAVSAEGRLDRHAYEDVLIPLLKEKLAQEGKIKLFYVLGPDFTGFSAGAAWDDTWFGMSHLADFARMAIVTDVEWIRMGMKLFSPLMRGRLHLFTMDQMDAAKDWIDVYHPEPDAGPEVAATHKLSTLEDKLPPQI